jgi:hypothetical protein
MGMSSKARPRPRPPRRDQKSASSSAGLKRSTFVAAAKHSEDPTIVNTSTRDGKRKRAEMVVSYIKMPAIGAEKVMGIQGDRKR